jgi:hypothetical protein
MGLLLTGPDIYYFRAMEVVCLYFFNDIGGEFTHDKAGT